MSRAAFIERNGGLYPMDADGEEIIKAMAGKKAMVNVHVPRNIRHHRLLFCLMKKLMDGGAWSGSKDDLLDYLKIATHLVRTLIDPADGKTYFVPESINFESMDQVAFARWFERVVYVVCQRLLPGHDWEELRDEIIDAVDGDLGQRAA